MATGIMLRTMSGTFCSLILAAISVAGLRAQMAPGLDAIRVASGLTQPLFVTAPPGDSGRLFIVQQDGDIRILNLVTGTLNSTPFLTLTGLTDQQVSKVCSAWRSIRTMPRTESFISTSPSPAALLAMA